MSIAVTTLTPFTSYGLSNSDFVLRFVISACKASLSFSRSLTSCMIVWHLFTMSSGFASLRLSAACWIVAALSSTSSRTPLPVTASIRLTPEATELSEIILNRPILEVLSRCVPPQNSIEAVSSPSPIVTTLTVSPYFSPNRAIAPSF